MVRNERGFTYPLTLCMLILFSTVLMLFVDQLISEKRMQIEIESILKQDYYILSAIKAIEEILALEDRTTSVGTIEFYDGQVHYVIVELTESLWEVRLQLQMGLDLEFNGTAYFDKKVGKIIKWVEKH